MSPLLLIIQPGQWPQRSVMSNLILRDLIANSFHRMLDDCKSVLILKKVLSQIMVCLR